MMLSRTPTQKDIAKHLAVSQSLVAGALSGNPRSGVSEATKRRVREAAEKMGYVPNAAGRMLHTGKTGSGVLAWIKPIANTAADNVHRSLYEVVAPFAEEVGELGYKLDIKCAPDAFALAECLGETISARACDAIFLWCGDEDTEIVGTALEGLGMPFVVRGDHISSHPQWVQAEYDHKAMIRQVVRLLANQGHERIAYLGLSFSAVFTKAYRDGFDEVTHEIFGRSRSARVDIEQRRIDRIWLGHHETDRQLDGLAGSRPADCDCVRPRRFRSAWNRSCPAGARPHSWR